MASKTAELKKINSDMAAGMGYECVMVQCSDGRNSAVLRIFIDSPGGIRHGDCESVSRAVSEFLDGAESRGESFFRGKYIIEVSSPGIERPLFTEEHYARFAGSKAELSVRGRGILRGVIASCGDGTVTLRAPDGEEISLPFGDIKKGNIAL